MIFSQPRERNLIASYRIICGAQQTVATAHWKESTNQIS